MKGDVVLVTGAGSGMGEATAIIAAERGGKVVVSDTSEKTVEAVVDKIQAAGGEAIAVVCDVTKASEVKTLIERTIKEYGRLDAAFNNAGIMLPNIDTADMPEDDFDRIVNINLKGIWLCMKYELLEMRKGGKGAIVNNSSIGGLVAGPVRSAYHATKHGILGLTKSATVEYAPKGIRINAVCPGTIETPMVEKMMQNGDLPKEATLEGTPIKRFGKSEEIAEAYYGC